MDAHTFENKYIPSGTRLPHGAVIKNCRLGKNVVIRSAKINNCWIDENPMMIGHSTVEFTEFKLLSSFYFRNGTFKSCRINGQPFQTNKVKREELTEKQQLVFDALKSLSVA